MLCKDPISYYDYLMQTDLSQCILNDNVTSGILISAQPASDTNVRCTGIPITTVSSSTNNTNSHTTGSAKSQLFVERRIWNSVQYPKGRAVIQIRADAVGDGSSSLIVSNNHHSEQLQKPTFSTSIQVTKELSLFASVNTYGHGWMGSHWDHTFYNVINYNKENEIEKEERYQQRDLYEGLDTMNRNDVNFKIGAWVPFQLNRDTIIAIPCTNNNSNKNKQQLFHGYAAINMLGATGAIHTSIQNKNGTNPYSYGTDTSSLVLQTRKYFSINLNDADRPPLQITIEKDDTTGNSTLSLTQIFTFDRYQYNPINTRIPKIRNTLAWTARLTSTPPSPGNTGINMNDDSKNDDYSNDNTEMSLGIAWQLNRSIAFKAILFPQKSAMTAAVLLKRWKQPRITTGIIKKFDFNINTASSITSGWGIGIEFEVGDYSRNPQSYYYNYHPNISSSSNYNYRQLNVDNDDNPSNNADRFVDDDSGEEDYPPTRAALPTNIEDRFTT